MIDGVCWEGLLECFSTETQSYFCYDFMPTEIGALDISLENMFYSKYIWRS